MQYFTKINNKKRITSYEYLNKRSHGKKKGFNKYTEIE